MMNDMEPKQRNRILGLLFVGVLMAALDIAIVGPALPSIRAEFGLDARQAAWIFTIYVLCNLVSTPLMARLSDMFGRRLLYVSDVALFGAGSFLVAMSPTFAVLMLGRAVQGLGAGGIFPVASAVIGDTFPAEKRGSALGLIGAVFGIAFLLGPLLAGVILSVLSWHWLFLINLPIAAALMWSGWRLLPTTRTQAEALFDRVGTVLLVGVLTSLTYGINQIDTAHVAESVRRVNVWGAWLLFGLSLPLFVWWERRVAIPVIQMRLFQSVQIVLTCAFAFGAGFGEASFVFVPDLLVAGLNVASSTASFMLLPAVLAMAVGSPIFGRMLDRVGARPVVASATGLAALGLLVLGGVPLSRASFYLAALLIGVGLSGLLGAALRYIMLQETPPEERASAQGILTLFTSVGQLVGGAWIGALAASRGGTVAGYQMAFTSVGIIMALLWLLSFRLATRGHIPETPPMMQIH